MSFHRSQDTEAEKRIGSPISRARRWPICGVCHKPHRPARATSAGPARCYHCGRTARKCECNLSWLRKIFLRLLPAI